MAADGSITLSVTIDTEEVNQQISQLESKLVNAFKNLNFNGFDGVSAKVSEINSKLQQTTDVTRQNTQAQQEAASATERQLTPLESLTNFMQIQRARLAELSAQYSNYVLTGQESSAEAQQLASDMQALSSSLADNESLLQSVSDMTSEAANVTGNFATAIQLATKFASNFTNDLKNLQSAANKVNTVFKKLASTIGVYFSIRYITKFFTESAESASETEAYLIRLGKLYGESAQDIYDWANENAQSFGMAKTSAYEAIAQYGNLLDVISDTNDRANASAQLVKATAVIASQTGRTFDETYEKIQSGLYGNTRAIDDLGISVRQASLEQTDAYKKITQGVKSWNDLTDAELMSVRAMAIIEQTTKRYGDEVLSTTSLVKSQFKAAWNDFKATWGKLVNKFLVPALEILTKILKVITAIISKFVGADDIGSSSVDNITDAEEALGDQIDETNSKLEKQLAGFDDLMILSGGLSDSLDDTSSGVDLDIDNILGDTTGTYDNSQYDYIIDSILDGLATLSEAIGAGLFAAGLIMLFCGQVFSGLGLMVAGATLYTAGATYHDNDEAQKTKEKLKNLVAYIPKAMIGLGIMLLFFGQFGWGIGLIIAGVIADKLADEETWEKFNEQELIDKLTTLEAWLGKAAASIGIILLFFGQIGWGIGLLVAGVYLWKDAKERNVKNGAGDEVVDDIVDWADGWKESLKALGYIAGLIGIILLLVPGCQGIGLGLLGKGAAVLFGVGAAEILSSEGDSIMDKIKNWCDEKWVELQDISWVMIALGVLCLFCGFAGVGIALLGTGLAMQYGTGKLIVDKDGSISAYFEKLGVYFQHKISNLGDVISIALQNLGLPEWLVDALGIGLRVVSPTIGALANFGSTSGNTLEEDLAAIDRKYEKLTDEAIDTLVNEYSARLNNETGGYYGSTYEEVQKTFAEIEAKTEAYRKSLEAQQKQIAMNDVYQAAMSAITSSSLSNARGYSFYSDTSTGNIYPSAAMANDYFARNNQQATVVLEVDGRAFGSAVVDFGSQEYSRIGASLVSTK